MVLPLLYQDCDPGSYFIECWKVSSELESERE